MRKSLREIAELVNGVVEGNESAVIKGIAGIKEAGPGEITFVANSKYLPLLPLTSASAVIVGKEAPACATNLIRTEHPYLAFTQVLKLFAPEPPTPKGIHPASIVGRDVDLGEDVALHASVVVEDGCRIGDKSVLYPSVFVGRGAQIGADCTIYPRVVIAQNVLVGNNVIIHSGAVIGGRPRPEGSAADGALEQAPTGTVIIEDDVEIGAGVTIDSAREGATIVGRGTKIDNLVHIGSDSAVGCNCIIVSQASVGSGCKMGDGVTLAGQAGILDGVTVGEGTIIAARAGVTEDTGENQVISGFPAVSHEKWLRTMVSIKRLPTMVRDIREFKKRLDTMDQSNDAEPENH
jgi:UDP-3-O-[3-hydroxymyristoyl] glucosamine N-acyltransferase